MHRRPPTPPMRNDEGPRGRGERHHWQHYTDILVEHLFLAFCTLGELLTLASTSRWLRGLGLPARCPRIIVHALAPYASLRATLQEGAHLMSVHISPKATCRFHEWMEAFPACTALQTLRFEARTRARFSIRRGQEISADIAQYLQKQTRLRTLVCPRFNTTLTWLPTDLMGAFP